MASGLTAGNDLFDTATEIRAASNVQNLPESPPTADADAEDGGVLQWVLTNRQWFRVNSNLVRIIVVQFGPNLRSWFSLEPSAADLDGGIQALQGQLSRLDALSVEYEFSYAIYLLHPMQELIRKTHDDTAVVIQAVAPASITVIDTAEAMLNNPAQYYFPFDGHLNPKGARAIADFLLARTNQDGG
jgi:lysophospholipase L1-like esterase